MKKFLFTALFVFISSLAFAQERIAVFPFEDRNTVYTKDELDSFYVEFSNEFRNKTDDSRFTVIPRQDIEKIINMEARFQLSDYSSKEKTAEMQRVLNAGQVLYCLILKVGNEIRITVSRYTFPELSVLRGGKTINVTNKNQLFSKIPELVQAMVTEIAGGITPVQTYKIGDTGPAGGIVFYDKEDNTGGWRYLEAIPAEEEFREWWGPGNDDEGWKYWVYNSDVRIGFGKINTERIFNTLEEIKKDWDRKEYAVHYCKKINYGGFNDWFIPSRDELDLMYKNLKQKGLGRFGDVRYLSSTENYSDGGPIVQDFADGKFHSSWPVTFPPFIRVIRSF